MDNKNRILESLADKRYDFRTVEGIAAETGISRDEITKILEENPLQVRKSPVPRYDGQALYAPKGRKIGWREKIAVIQQEFRRQNEELLFRAYRSLAGKNI